MGQETREVKGGYEDDDDNVDGDDIIERRRK